MTRLLLLSATLLAVGGSAGAQTTGGDTITLGRGEMHCGPGKTCEWVSRTGCLPASQRLTLIQDAKRRFDKARGWFSDERDNYRLMAAQLPGGSAFMAGINHDLGEREMAGAMA